MFVAFLACTFMQQSTGTYLYDFRHKYSLWDKQSETGKLAKMNVNKDASKTFGDK